MPPNDLDDPWMFAVIVVAIWGVIWGLMEMFLWDGRLLVGVLQSLPGSLAFSALYLVVQRNREG